MRGVSILLVLGLAAGWGAGQFLNNRPHPTYSLESMPDTDFTCRDKILGGYYADSQTQCQMFHICVKVAGVGVQDFRFLCPNGTAFDQDHQICAEWDDVDCDATTLYYASDNFDLYRLGSGFESKAVKYGEEEETFSLQRAETGDARLNREHQASRINQQKEFNNHAATSQRRHQNVNNNNNNNNNNSEKDIFKTSSSSNFFNNRNGGKEVDDDDEDDSNVNANQNRDHFQKRKLVRKQQRRPVEQQQQQQQQTAQPQQQQQQRPQQQRPQQPQQPRVQPTQPQQQPQQNQQQQQPQQQNHQVRQPQQQQARPQQQQQQQQQQARPQQQQQQQVRPQQQQVRQQSQQTQFRPQQTTQAQQNTQTTTTTQNVEAQTSRSNRPTGFVNNFAGSFPTTARPTVTSTASNLNQDQYSTAINNFRQRNGQRRPVNRQYNDADNFRQTTPLAAVSTPAPFRQAQQTKQTTYNNGQYNPTTFSPKSTQTENYPPNFKKENYQTTQGKPAPFKHQSPKENYPTTAAVVQTSAAFVDTHYDVPKIKSTTVKQISTQKENYPTTFAPAKPKQKEVFLATTFAPKTQNTQQFYNTNNGNNNNNNNNKQTTPFYNTQNFQQFNNQFQGQQQNTQKPKQQPQPFSNNNQNQQFGNNQQQNRNQQNNNQQNNQQQFTAQPSTPQAFNPTNHFSRPFANQFSNQNQNQNDNFNSQKATETSTPKTTPFTQYTPTVPKVSSTTPIARSNRFDETQYDDGSYSTKYDQYDDNANPSQKEDEFLKTAHSQNIASSRNEFVKNAKKASSSSTSAATTEKPYYSESPRPFSTNTNTHTKVTENYPKTTKLVATPRPTEKKHQQQQQQQQQQQYQQPQQQQQHRQQQQQQQKPQQQQQQQKQQPQQQQQQQQQPQKQQKPAGSNEKNASYDYAYYDSNVGPEPEYDIDTDFKKTTVV